MSRVATAITRYTITAVVEGSMDPIAAELFNVEVERVGQRDGGYRWAVRRGCRCLDRACNWSFEPIPSERDDRFLAAHRFDLETALRLAERAAPLLVVNGRRPDGSMA